MSLQLLGLAMNLHLLLLPLSNLSHSRVPLQPQSKQLQVAGKLSLQMSPHMLEKNGYEVTVGRR